MFLKNSVSYSRLWSQNVSRVLSGILLYLLMYSPSTGPDDDSEGHGEDPESLSEEFDYGKGVLKGLLLASSSFLT